MRRALRIPCRAEATAVVEVLAAHAAGAVVQVAAGAVPAVAFYYYFRNQANNIILNMVITTIDLIKALRNVEVMEE